MANVRNADLREEIYRSKISYTDLSRADQRALPFPDIFVDRREDIPVDFKGLAKVNTSDHLPDGFKPPFAPFQLVRDGETIASAFLDKNGCASLHGRLTNNLGVLLHRLVTAYSHKANWIGYSYRDDMIAFALAESLVPVLKIDEDPSRGNPFAYLTTNTYFAFVKIQKKETALGRHRHTMVEAALKECAWTVWRSEEAEADNSLDAIAAELNAEMDSLLRDELRRRDAGEMHKPRTAKFKLKMSPMLSDAIKYGLNIGLSSAAIGAHFGLEAATVSRVKNNVVRKRTV